MADSSSKTPDVLLWEWDRADADRAGLPLPTKFVDDMRRLLNNPAHRFESGHLPNHLAEEEKTALKSWFVDAKLPVDNPATLQQDAVVRTTDATAVLLSRLPALKTLDVETFDRTADDEWTKSRPPGDPFMTTLNQLIISAQGNSTFQNIETVKLLVPVPDEELVNEFNFYLYADTVLPLFYLPRIQTLELHRVDDGRKPLSWPVSEIPSATTLKELVLIRCQLSEENTDTIIRVAPNLKKLRSEHAIDAEYASAWFDLAKVKASLSTLKDSLEDFSLAMTLWTSTAIDCGEAGPWGILNSLGSLKDFKQLTRLAISLPVLLGWQTKGSAKLIDVLPENIQSLTVTNEMYFWWRYQWDDLDWDDDDPVVPRWQSLEAKIVEYLESRPRSLRKLKVEISVADEEERAAELKADLVSKGEAVGVKVDVELKP
ncbi:F-box domain protein [Colletotrichum tofieldiae]|nr:F-box domain protein [Colletotrichum tofieldiae]GKT70343.1 F-box domain protein [Colletotrichum tofieldiae]